MVLVQIITCSWNKSFSGDSLVQLAHSRAAAPWNWYDGGLLNCSMYEKSQKKRQTWKLLMQTNSKYILETFLQGDLIDTNLNNGCQNPIVFSWPLEMEWVDQIFNNDLFSIESVFFLINQCCVYFAKYTRQMSTINYGRYSPLLVIWSKIPRICNYNLTEWPVADHNSNTWFIRI